MTRTWIVRAEEEPEKRAIQHAWGIAVINESFPKPKPAAAKKTWAWKPGTKAASAETKSEAVWPQLPAPGSKGKLPAAQGANGAAGTGNTAGAPGSTAPGAAQQEAMNVDGGASPPAEAAAAKGPEPAPKEETPNLAALIQAAVQEAMGRASQQMANQLAGLQQGMGDLQAELMALKAPMEEEEEGAIGEATHPRPAARTGPAQRLCMANIQC